MLPRCLTLLLEAYGTSSPKSNETKSWLVSQIQVQNSKSLIDNQRSRQFRKTYRDWSSRYKCKMQRCSAIDQSNSRPMDLYRGFLVGSPETTKSHYESNSLTNFITLSLIYGWVTLHFTLVTGQLTWKSVSVDCSCSSTNSVVHSKSGCIPKYISSTAIYTI